MDGLLFIIIAIVFVVLDNRTTESDESVVVEEVYDTTRTTKLNEDFYDNPNAFSKIINALGYPKGRD